MSSKDILISLVKNNDPDKIDLRWIMNGSKSGINIIEIIFDIPDTDKKMIFSISMSGESTEIIGITIFNNESEDKINFEELASVVKDGDIHEIGKFFGRLGDLIVEAIIKDMVSKLTVEEGE